MGKLHMSSDRAAVKAFLDEMKSVLSSDGFDIGRDFFFQLTRKGDEPDDEYTNQNTIIKLGYSTADIVNVLLRLELEDYSESVVDSVADGFKIFYVFGKRIGKKEIYIKVRMKQRGKGQKGYVFCISFHFARKPIAVYPYRKTKRSEDIDSVGGGDDERDNA